MWSAFKSGLTAWAAPDKRQEQTFAANRPIRTTYASNPVPIPPDFLLPLPLAGTRANPVTARPVDWTAAGAHGLPEYAGLYAVVLDHVLTPQECAQLLALAEASVPADALVRNGEGDPWGPALVNIGGGFEVLQPTYRNSDRIVWDCQEVVDRIWARCLEAEGVWERLAEVAGEESDITGHGLDNGRWKFLRVNERMRFLRYGKGGFFQPHCDAPYADTSDLARTVKTLFTVHLYLNDSKAEAGAGQAAELVGGATTFYSRDGKRRIDVHPKAGRVLIFQHRHLLHAGDEVRAGTKYTMRTDIMYEFVPDEAPAEAQGSRDERMDDA